jgi:hypothetical protein
VVQAQKYCSDGGFRFGVATNGYSFIIFRGITDGSRWKSGTAIVFNDLKTIESNFVEFLNLLSYDAVKDGLLDEAFRAGNTTNREFHRPIAGIVDRDATYGRNSFNVGLRPYVERFFGDIASQNAVQILEKCYVKSTPIQVIDSDLKIQIRDSIPRFAEGTMPIEAITDDAKFGNDIKDAIEKSQSHPHVVLVMGGIGSGKTTFLKRFFSIVAPEYTSESSPVLHVYIDFLGSPDQLDRLFKFLWTKMADALRAANPLLNVRSNLEIIFERELAVLRSIYTSTPDALEMRIQDELLKLSQDTEKFSKAALRFIVSLGRLPLIIFDNVDQLATEIQIPIYTIAQNLAIDLKCMSIVGLREESYCTAQMQRHLTAYTIRPYHLASPRFRELIEARIDLATNVAANASSQEGEVIGLKLPGNETILAFFNALRYSIFNRNQNIVRMIEAISFGNMRFALDLFNNFITSGATDISKIIKIFIEDGKYNVPFHEFAKSVILGEYRYYKESRSYIGNLFDVTSARNASHFTSLRLLSLLNNAKNREGAAEGFIPLQDVISAFADTFDNEEDCVQTVRRLMRLNRQLVELDTRRTESLDGASLIRITSAGAYYFDYLVNAFSYLDLVWQDTPFTERAICEVIARTIQRVDLIQRIERVDIFLSYLDRQEKDELKDRGLVGEHELHGPFIPRIRRFFSKEKKIIIWNASQQTRSKISADLGDNLSAGEQVHNKPDENPQQS